MNETRLCSLEQLQAFLDATAEAQFLPSAGEDAARTEVDLGADRHAGDKAKLPALALEVAAA